jgi:hypothetical protein
MDAITIANVKARSRALIVEQVEYRVVGGSR